MNRLLTILCWAIISPLFAQSPVLRIMPFGDSNTRGTMEEPDGGYRWPLQRLLDSAGVRYDFVGSQTLKSTGMIDPEHQGIGGWRITHLLDGHTDVARQLSSPNVTTLLDTYRPDLILLMAGTNDIFGGASGAEVAQRFDTLLARIFAHTPTVKLLAANQLPLTVGVFKTGAVKPEHLTAVAEFSARIPAIVERYRSQGRSIGFVDTQRSVLPNQLIDHVHPNTQGMQQVARTWFNAYQNLTNEKGRDSTQDDPILPEIFLHERSVSTNHLPGALAVRPDLGLVTYPWVQGQIIFKAPKGLYEVRATITPKGDYLMMFPNGEHYNGKNEKVNDMMAIRSSDRGKTWQQPLKAFDIDYNQHGFIPLIPKGTSQLYAFGTQPIWQEFTMKKGQQENAPIGFRKSEDDGHTWSDVTLIRPINDPTFKGMSVMRMTETDRGTWLLGSHEADWSQKPLKTRLYLLRSTDRGQTWTVLPGKRPAGWQVPGFGRMDEGRPLALGNGKVLYMIRTPEGHLWASWSKDDGQTWTTPKPTPLVHPDAPPMVFPLSDGQTIIAFHHNRSHTRSSVLDGTNKTMMADRSEIWFATSRDGGHTWSEPRFVFANALAETLPDAWRNYNCSYLDAFVDKGEIHLFLPHRWQRVVYLHIKESDLSKFPTSNELWR